uniref:Transmembrane protein 53 n=1 Tax=Rhabditophanes sp. KR3021 TaxID=114890 RepID=A0AC35UEV5_9BILA
MSSVEVGNLEIHQTSQESTVLIVLIGWAGCQDRHLAKYAKIYETGGFDTIRLTVPIRKIRGLTCYDKFTGFIYERLAGIKDIATKGIIFHVFSMNGGNTFLKVYEKYLQEKGDWNIKGVIFDSCPADVQPSQLALAITMTMYPSTKYGGISSILTQSMLYAHFLFERTWVYLHSLVNADAYSNYFAYFKLLSMKTLPRNQLYIYSDADKICSSSSTEKFLEEQIKVVDQTVLVAKFDNSDHVQHYRAHPQEYTERCIKFVNDTCNKY